MLRVFDERFVVANDSPGKKGNAVGVTTESATMQFLARPSGAGASLSPISSRMQDRLRRRLGLKPKDWVLERSVRINGWIATGIVTLIAALTRLIGLGHPDRLMFDEIYYVKDAYALWHNGYESVWSHNADELFSEGNFSTQLRSEERRVGKECRSRWSPYH